MESNKTFFYTALLLLILVFIAKTFWYSQRAVPYYEADIRNKIVGARLQKDGISPYFYHWKKGEPVKYYDPNAQGYAPSMCTSTPFQHKLFYPLTSLPQSTINKIWISLLTVFFITITVLAVTIATSHINRLLVLSAALLLYFSHAWKANLTEGQTYIVIPFVLMLIMFIVYKQATKLTAFVCGILVTGVILFKPNVALVYLPFIFIVQKINRKQVILFSAGALLLVLLNLLSSKETSLWKDYFTSVKAYTRIWQEPGTNVYPPAELLNEWEGINPGELKLKASLHPLGFDKEMSNFFIIYTSQLHKPAAMWFQYTLFFISSAILLFFFYTRKIKSKQATLIDLFLTGVCIYTLNEIFSPIGRSSYYSVQWIFPLLLIAAFYNNRNKFPLLLIAGGLLLSIITIPSIKWEHTLGEVLFFTASIIVLLQNKTDTSSIPA